jgi:hypothetical protein
VIVGTLIACAGCAIMPPRSIGAPNGELLGTMPALGTSGEPIELDGPRPELGICGASECSGAQPGRSWSPVGDVGSPCHFSGFACAPYALGDAGIDDADIGDAPADTAGDPLAKLSEAPALDIGEIKSKRGRPCAVGSTGRNESRFGGAPYIGKPPLSLPPWR